MNFNQSQVPSTQIPYCSYTHVPTENVQDQINNQALFSYPYYQNSFNFNNYSKSSYTISNSKNNENNSQKECQSSLEDNVDGENTGFAPK